MTKQIDLDDQGRNMFGILPCPKCQDTHRWPTQSVHPKHPNSIICDGCGYVEPVDLPIADIDEPEPYTRADRRDYLECEQPERENER